MIEQPSHLTKISIEYGIKAALPYLGKNSDVESDGMGLLDKTVKNESLALLRWKGLDARSWFGCSSDLFHVTICWKSLVFIKND